MKNVYTAWLAIYCDDENKAHRIRISCTYHKKMLVSSLIDSDEWLADTTKGHN